MATVTLSLSASGNNWLYIGNMYSNGRPEYYNVNLTFKPTKNLSKVVLNIAFGGYNGGNSFAYSFNGTSKAFTWSGNSASITLTHAFTANTTYTVNLYVTTANLGYVQLSSYSATGTVQSYAVSYNANGGSGAPSAQTKDYGATLTLSSTKPTKTSTTATGYKVTFNANGGTAFKTSETATDTTKYTFSKWNTALDGSGTSYNAGGSYTANAAATLYAQYTSITTKGSVTLPTAEECTRNGHSLLGWASSSTVSVADYPPGAVINPTANITLYAVWSISACHIYLADSTNTLNKYRVYIYTNGSWALHNPHVYTNGMWIPTESIT